MSGHLAVLGQRLDALKLALDAQPGRTPEVEWEYDRVLRAFQKLVREEEQPRVRIVGGPDAGAVYTVTERASDGCLIVRAARPQPTP